LLAAYQKPMSAPLIASIAGLSIEDVVGALAALRVRQLAAFAGGADLYRTAHDHIRTTVYAEMGPDAAAVHRGIGTALERSLRDGEPRLSETAHHYWLAQDRDKALEYALLAGRAAMAVYANGEVIEHFEHALALLPADAAVVRARTCEQLADAHFLAGHYEEARSLLTDAEHRVDERIDKVRIRRKMGEVVGYHAGTPMAAVDIMWTAAQQLGAWRPASRATFLLATVTALARHLLQRFAGRMVPLANDMAARRALAELVNIYLRISYLSFFGDPLLTFLPTFRAANLSDRLGESNEHSNAYSMAAIALAGLGFAPTALRYVEAATREANRLGSPWHIANTHNFHALILQQTGQWSSARAHAELAHQGFAACGDHFQLAIALYSLLENFHARGALHEAIARGRGALAVFERLGLQMIGKGPYTVFGQALAKTGDLEGLRVGEDVLARAQQGADRLSTAFAHVALGDSLLHLGRLDEAIDHLERGLAIRDEGRFDVYLIGRGSALLAQAYAERLRVAGEGRRGMRESFNRSVSGAVAAGRRFPPLRSCASLIRGLQYRLHGRVDQAIASFANAATGAASQGARLWEAEAHFERGLALVERDGPGSAAGRTALEQARSLFHDCGARPKAQRTVDELSRL
ncbi:MAG: tetratricopeptide repeat protein, partial [Vicinamibacterales bacterium]